MGYQGWNLFKSRKSIGNLLWLDHVGKGHRCYTRFRSMFRKKNDLMEWNETRNEIKSVAVFTDVQNMSFSSCTFYECENWNLDVREARREIGTWINIFTTWIDIILNYLYYIFCSLMLMYFDYGVQVYSILKFLKSHFRNLQGRHIWQLLDHLTLQDNINSGSFLVGKEIFLEAE